MANPSVNAEPPASSLDFQQTKERATEALWIVPSDGNGTLLEVVSTDNEPNFFKSQEEEEIV